MGANLESIGGKLFVNGEEIALKSDLETKTQIVDFGTVSNNTRTVKANPFFDGVNDAEIATRCVVRAEVQIGGVWSDSGWFSTSSYAAGVRASSNSDGIVIQSGKDKVYNESNISGGGSGVSANANSAPCRVIIFYNGYGSGGTI